MLVVACENVSNSSKVSLTSEEVYVPVLLQKYLRLHKQSVEAIEEELPVDDLPIREGVVQLVNGLEHDWSVDDEEIELGFQAEQQTLDRLIVNGTQIESGALGHVHIDIVHASDQVTKSCGQRRLQSHFGT